MLWCECPLVGMQWCKCPIVGMPWYKCPLVGMQWCKCTLVGMLWWKYTLERCAMMRMFRCKHNLFKNSLYFQNEASSAPETKILSKLDLLFLKSHLLFGLRLLKNWWSLLEIFEWGIGLETDDLAQKIYFHNLVEQKGWHAFRAFFWKTNSLKIKHLKKIHFFSLWIWQFDRPQNLLW